MKRSFWLLAVILASTTLLFGQNIIANGDFATGTSPWGFWQNSNWGNFQVVGGAAKLSVTQAGANVQLFQRNLRLEPNTRYKLTFWAYSSAGHDLDIFLHKDVMTWQNYGVDYAVNLTTGWSFYTTEFTTTGFNGTVNDGRLRFWLSPYAVAGDVYYFDEVVLAKYPHTAVDVLEAVADASVRNDFSILENDNYGKNNFLQIGTGRTVWGSPDAMRSLILFDLKGIPYSANQLVSAQLDLTFFHSGNGLPTSVFNVGVYRIIPSGNRTPWVEGNGFIANPIPPGVGTMPPRCLNTDAANGVAWSGFPDNSDVHAANNITQPDFAPASYATVAIPRATAVPGQVFSWNVTTLAREWLSGTYPNLGIMLRDVTTDNSFRELALTARESRLMNITDNRGIYDGPRLILTFDPNIVQNPTFDLGANNWFFWHQDRFKPIDIVNMCGRTNLAKLIVDRSGSNIQLFQRNLALLSNSRYRLSFWAYSSSGHDLSVFVHKDGYDYHNYGLNGYVANLSNVCPGQLFTREFTTTGFSGTTYDGRIRFWLAPYASASDVYYIDQVSLEWLGPAKLGEQTQTTAGTGFQLAQNFPNPFNPTTNISFAIPNDGNVSLKVFDLLGREVASLVNEVRTAGSYTETFDASALSSGTYFYRLESGSFVQTKKMLIVR